VIFITDNIIKIYYLLFKKPYTDPRKCRQESVTELPMPPALEEFYMKHQIVLFQRLRYESGLSVQKYDQF
jgi:hypothetical protein